MYVKGKTTVMLNVSGCILNTGILNRARRPITLHAKPEKGQVFVDIDKVCDPNVVDAYFHEFADWTKRGMVTWHKKGTIPAIPHVVVPMILPMAEGETRIAPPNIYDQKLNELQEKEEREDEKTKPTSTRRDMARAVPVPGHPVAMSPGSQQTRYADASQGEIDAGAGTGGASRTRTADASQGEIDGAQMRPAPGTQPIVRPTPPPAKYAETLVGELFEAAVEAGVIVKEGKANFSFEGEKLAFGKKKACDALDTNPELLERVRAAMNALGG